QPRKFSASKKSKPARWIGGKVRGGDSSDGRELQFSPTRPRTSFRPANRAADGRRSPQPGWPPRIESDSLPIITVSARILVIRTKARIPLSLLPQSFGRFSHRFRGSLRGFV